jgi:ABC-2 type transport system permease protein
MNTTIKLGYGILKKEVLLLSRYRLNTLSYVLLMYGIFLGIFLGGRTLGGDAFDDSLGEIVVGFFLATLSFTAFNRVAATFTKEASWGTLEQMYASTVGFRRISLLVSVAQLLISSVIGLVVFTLMLLTTNRQISLDVVSVVPVAVLALASVIGIGLLVGGTAVLYKRVNNVYGIAQFFIYGLVAAPVEQYPLLKLLPISQGSYVLRLVMNDGVALWEVPPTELAILVGTGVGYLAVGYYGLGYLVGIARDRGVMGHY